MKENKLTVTDIFCGAGGFSEGFRQAGFKILYGIDKWKPAIDTFNFNFQTNFNPIDVLKVANTENDIEMLPDTDVIIGSPPCVSFSNSNKSGKADKSLGIKLIESFLRIIVIKKYKKNSILKAWFMENVINSGKYLKEVYTFDDLDLTNWATKNNFNTNTAVINIKDNSRIVNSANYGAPQNRKRLIVGEVIKQKKIILMEETHKAPELSGNKPNYKTLKELRSNFPTPFEKMSNCYIIDPIYGIKLHKSKLTDHFYDTGIYESDWELSKYWKINHPYMGKMSFPEDENKPSRTITATKIANSRESIVYKSEVNRGGNGEYRCPTVREAGLIMGFPISYQFLGSENTKWKLIGNAVCPCVSYALATSLIKSLNLKQREKVIINEYKDYSNVGNLNTFKVKTFNNPPKKKPGSKFRRHPFKLGNMTVELSNFNIIGKSKKIGNWRSIVFYGTGEGYLITNLKDKGYKRIELIIEKSFDDGKDYINNINSNLCKKVAGKSELQKMYEMQNSIDSFLEPTLLVKEVANIVNLFAKDDEIYIQKGKGIFKKKVIPKKQLYALYAINKITTIANNK